MKKVLIIDSHPTSRELLLKLLKREKIRLFSVDDAAGGVEFLNKYTFDLIFSDLKGIKTLDRLKKRPLTVPLVQIRMQGEEIEKSVAGVLKNPIEKGEVMKMVDHLASMDNHFEMKPYIRNSKKKRKKKCCVTVLLVV